jgi:ComF family protein
LQSAAHGCDALLELLAPTRCVGCDVRTGARIPLCAACRELLQPPAPCSLAGVRVLSAAVYRAPVQRAIRRLKYDGRPDLAAPLARLVQPCLGDLRTADLLLVPVPVHPRRLAERGYNQAALIAGALARLGPWTPAPFALGRRNWSGAQVGRNRAARLSSVAQDFVVRQPRRVEGRTVVVVDDVVTTGATAYSCLSALREAGAEVAAVIAVARAGGGTEELVPQGVAEG